MGDDCYGVEWVPTTDVVYRSIYSEHHESMATFSTHTCIEGCLWHGGGTHIYTSWGFRGASAPLIRSERDGDSWRYYVARFIERGESDG